MGLLLQFLFVRGSVVSDVLLELSFVISRVSVRCLGRAVLRVRGTVELQWLEHHWDHGNLIGVVRATEG